jgi:phage gp29-like protein
VEAASRSGGANPYQLMADFCNREMSKAVLGQTLTTDTSGSTGTYAAASVHAQVRRDLVEADAQALAVTLREQLLRPLARIIHEKCLKKHRVSAKMLLSLNKQLLGKDTLWKQSAITSSGLKAFFPKKLLPILPGA